jgi:hypothetical protein
MSVNNVYTNGIKVAPRERDTFTRAKAEKALANGADPTDERFTKHANKHVVAYAARLAAAVSV